MAKKIIDLVILVILDTTDGMLACLRRSKREFMIRFMVWVISTVVLGIGLVAFASNSPTILVLVLMLSVYVGSVGFLIPSSLFTQSDIISRWPH